jgi:hypothetical protein
MTTAHTNIIKNFHTLSETVQNKKIWKDRAHEYFDIIWERRNYVERNLLYKYLGEYLGTCPHMGQMTVSKCKLVVEWSIDVLNSCTKKEHEFGIHIHSLIEYPDYL